MPMMQKIKGQLIRLPFLPERLRYPGKGFYERLDAAMVNRLMERSFRATCSFF